MSLQPQESNENNQPNIGLEITTVSGLDKKAADNLNTYDLDNNYLDENSEGTEPSLSLNNEEIVNSSEEVNNYNSYENNLVSQMKLRDEYNKQY